MRAVPGLALAVVVVLATIRVGVVVRAIPARVSVFPSVLELWRQTDWSSGRSCCWWRPGRSREHSSGCPNDQLHKSLCALYSVPRGGLTWVFVPELL